MWEVPVHDADPPAKGAASRSRSRSQSVPPVPPEPIPGHPFAPVVFEHMSVTPYVVEVMKGPLPGRVLDPGPGPPPLRGPSHGSLTGSTPYAAGAGNIRQDTHRPAVPNPNPSKGVGQCCPP